MKKLMMVMVVGLALGATGFAQERGNFGRRFSSDGRRASEQFSERTARGGNYVGGFVGNRVPYGGPREGIGYSYAPAPAYASPHYVAPAYCPPVAGGVVVRGGFVRGRTFVGRGVGSAWLQKVKPSTTKVT